MPFTHDQEERINNALSTDRDSQAAYVGRITQEETILITSEDGTPIQATRHILISWDTIKEMLALIRSRAGL